MVSCQTRATTKWSPAGTAVIRYAPAASVTAPCLYVNDPLLVRAQVSTWTSIIGSPRSFVTTPLMVPPRKSSTLAFENV